MTWIAPDVVRPDVPTAGDERATLEAYLAWHRATLLHKCAGLSGEQLAVRAVPPSSLSLLGLVRHLTDVERAWFRRRLAGEDIDGVYHARAWTDDEFDDVDPERAEVEYARYLEECKLADASAADRSLDDTFEHRGEVVSLRWVYCHMIEEYARHNGHADLLREVTDGVTGE